MSYCKGKRDDEFFAGNVHRNVTVDLSEIEGHYRFGDIAYTLEGAELGADYKPLFVRKSHEDAYDRIMVRSFNSIRGNRS